MATHFFGYGSQTGGDEFPDILNGQLGDSAPVQFEDGDSFFNDAIDSSVSAGFDFASIYTSRESDADVYIPGHGHPPPQPHQTIDPSIGTGYGQTLPSASVPELTDTDNTPSELDRRFAEASASFQPLHRLAPTAERQYKFEAEGDGLDSISATETPTLGPPTPSILITGWRPSDGAGKRKRERLGPDFPKRSRSSDPPKTKVKCAICQKEMTEGALPRHRKKFHGSERESFRCAMCSQSFTRNDNRKRHVELKHPDSLTSA